MSLDQLDREACEIVAVNALCDEPSIGTYGDPDFDHHVAVLSLQLQATIAAYLTALRVEPGQQNSSPDGVR